MVAEKQTMLELGAPPDPIAGETFEINMGPQHPATHGVLRLLLTLDGETVRGCEPHLGYLHRGVEKIGELPLMFSPQDLLVMQQLRAVFDPHQRSNPGKIFPTPGGCVEVKRPRRQVPL